MNSKMRRVSKGQKVNTLCGENYLINTRLNLKTKFVSEKKKNTIRSEMSWSNILQRTGLDFCATNNFEGIYAHFCFIIFIQERIITYIDPCP